MYKLLKYILVFTLFISVLAKSFSRGDLIAAPLIVLLAVLYLDRGIMKKAKLSNERNSVVNSYETKKHTILKLVTWTLVVLALLIFPVTVLDIPADAPLILLIIVMAVLYLDKSIIKTSIFNSKRNSMVNSYEKMKHTILKLVIWTLIVLALLTFLVTGLNLGSGVPLIKSLGSGLNLQSGVILVGDYRTQNLESGVILVDNDRIKTLSVWGLIFVMAVYYEIQLRKKYKNDPSKSKTKDQTAINK